MPAFEVIDYAIRGVLTLAFLVGIVFGIRAIATGRIAAWLCVAGCVILLCTQIGTFVFEFLALHSSQQLWELYRWTTLILQPSGMLALVASAIFGVLPKAAQEQVDHPAWSYGKRLLTSAMISLAILPVGMGITLAMLKTRELIIGTTLVGLLAVPSIVTWLLASRYLEALRVETAPSGQRPIGLWAYGIASLSSLGAIFLALFAFILLGLQQGWIQQ